MPDNPRDPAASIGTPLRRLGRPKAHRSLEDTRMSGCNSFYYNSIDMKLDPEQMVNILYAYIESGLPEIIGASVA